MNEAGIEAAAVLRALPDAVVVIDDAGRLRWANEAAERVFDVRGDDLVGTSAIDFVHPDDIELAVLSLQSVQEKVVGTPLELRLRAGTGWRLVEVVGANMLDDERIGGIVLSLRDLTERRRWEVASGDDHRFRSLVQNASSILMLLDADGRILSVSAALSRLLGQDQERVEGRPLTSLVPAPQRGDMASALSRALESPELNAGPTTIEVELLRGDGSASVPFELSIVNLMDDPTVEGLVVSAHDITQLRATREALEELATHDPLTGLPNRSALLTQLAARVSDTATAVIFIDLDGFKPINDEYGHATGDELLRQMAERLRNSVRKDDLVARYGGDEFVVVATVTDEAEVARLTARLAEGIELPLELPDGVFALSASIGMAQPRPSDTPLSLLARADTAMYLAKQGGISRRRIPAY
ncbi:MAG: diguanylate cyclase [Acidimicrobiales bacterium]